jgi:hypothetical protein
MDETGSGLFLVVDVGIINILSQVLVPQFFSDSVISLSEISSTHLLQQPCLFTL